jgi:OOP family OmpA-OmpF porin
VVAAGAKIELPEIVSFDPNKPAVVGKLAMSTLDKVAEKLKANGGVKRVRIEGHADGKEGAPKKRQTLSQERAEAVRDYLIKKGVEPERLQAVGYGDARPIDKRNTADARAKNRRVEFIVVEQ